MRIIQNRKKNQKVVFKMLKLEKFTPEEFASNNYLLYNDETKTAVLFDPSGCYDKVVKFIKENNLNLKTLIVTHIHFDHLGDIRKYQDNFKEIKTVIPKGDKPMYENLMVQCDLFGVKRVDNFKVDEFVDENSKLFIDDIEIKIISTPGHSFGSTCYLIGDILISGDTLFREEIGRCDLPTGSFDDIKNSIKEKLFKLDSNVKVFPGHGANTDIGHEKEFNAYFGLRAIY